jgi:hypothetical protein
MWDKNKSINTRNMDYVQFTESANNIVELHFEV